MIDSWMKGRVKGVHRETFPDEEQATETPGAARAEPQEQTQAQPEQAEAEPPEQAHADPGSDVQRQALEMLTLAQRTAEEHVANAQSQADRIEEAARATAERIVRDAQAQGEAVRREADKALSEARVRAEEIARDAQVHAGNARRDGDKIISDAQARAAEIAKDAQASADGLRRRAELRYEEMVGNLAATREALQQQIEALQEFDRDYRARLLTFMQAQLRALWVDEPHVDVEIERPGAVAGPAPSGTAAPIPDNDRVATGTDEASDPA